MPSIDDQITDLRAQIAALQTAERPPTATSRRGLLLRAFGVVTAVGVVADARPAAAAAGSPLLLENVIQTAASPTGLKIEGAVPAYGIGVTDSELFSLPYEAGEGGALLGYARGVAFEHGVLGIADGNHTGVRGLAIQGTGVLGTGRIGTIGLGTETGVIGSGNIGVSGSGTDIGGRFDGKHGALLVTTPWSVAPPSNTTLQHAAGTIDADPDGGLWHCVVAGTPGTWRHLSGVSAAGAFHPLPPTRIYDSRAPQPAQVALTSGGVRTIGVADGRDIITGAVNAVSAIPAGTTAITCNVTVVGTSGAGFLTLNPGGTTSIGGASINWFADGQILNNGTVVAVAPNRTITIVAGGTGATDVVVDVTGYFR